MIEGKDIKWVYLKEGVKFGKYNSVNVESFGSIANKPTRTSKKISETLMYPLKESERRHQIPVRWIIRAPYKVEE